MDHQVEDHVDLHTAIFPRRDTVALEIKGIGDDLGERAIGAGEALDMADLQHRLSLLGKACEHVPGFETVGDRLLHQNVDTGLDELARDLVVERGRHGDAHRIDPADDVAIV